MVGRIREAMPSLTASHLARWSVAGQGCLLLTTILVVAVVRGGDAPVGVALAVAPTVGLVALGAYVASLDVARHRMRRVIAWYSAGVIAVAAFGGTFRLAGWIGPGATPELVALTLVAGGGTAGTLVGLYDVRARQYGEDLGRQHAERRHLRDQRETLALLNQILRHQLLNDLSVISGYVDLAINESGPVDRHLAVVRSRCDEMVDTIDTIRTVAESLTTAPDLEPVDLGTVVRDAVDSVALGNPGADIRLDAPPDGVTVSADDLLGVAVHNVVQNAVDHHDGPGPTVRVSIRTTDRGAVVSVADDGPGFPDDATDAMLEANVRGADSDGDGLGLFLTDCILDRYGGDVRLEDNRPTGAVVELVVPCEDAGDPTPSAPLPAPSGTPRRRRR